MNEGAVPYSGIYTDADEDTVIPKNGYLDTNYT